MKERERERGYMLRKEELGVSDDPENLDLRKFGETLVSQFVFPEKADPETSS